MLIPSFIFELSTFLFAWLMASFCLQNVKEVYKVNFVSKWDSTQRRSLQLKYISKHHINTRESFFYSVQLMCNVSFNYNLLKIRYRYSILPYGIIVTCKQNDVISYYPKSVDSTQTKRDTKEI